MAVIESARQQQELGYNLKFDIRNLVDTSQEMSRELDAFPDFLERSVKLGLLQATVIHWAGRTAVTQAAVWNVVEERLEGVWPKNLSDEDTLELFRDIAKNCETEAEA